MIKSNFVRSTGKVGIGTASPAALLDVSTNSGAEIRTSSTDIDLAAREVIGRYAFYKADASGGGAGTPVFMEAVAHDIGLRFNWELTTGSLTTPMIIQMLT